MGRVQLARFIGCLIDDTGVIQQIDSLPIAAVTYASLSAHDFNQYPTQDYGRSGKEMSATSVENASGPPRILLQGHFEFSLRDARPQMRRLAGALFLEMVRIEPLTVPKRQLTGADTELVDTRVVEVVFRAAPSIRLFPGQLVDTYISTRINEPKTLAALQ